MTNSKTCYVMIGLPASGKSTWIQNSFAFPSYGQPDKSQDTIRYVCSSDHIIESVSAQYGMSYDDGFSSLIDFASKAFWERVKTLTDLGVDIVIDRTNLTVKSRKRLINMLKAKGYAITAVVLKVDDEDEWKRRLNSRPGKTIPDNVIESMIKTYAEPQKSEGFDSIEYHTSV